MNSALKDSKSNEGCATMWYNKSSFSKLIIIFLSSAFSIIMISKSTARDLKDLNYDNVFSDRNNDIDGQYDEFQEGHPSDSHPSAKLRLVDRIILTSNDNNINSTMTGNWFGFGKKMLNKGINIGISYSSETGTNVSGGKSKKLIEAGQFIFSSTIDTNKLIGLKGGTFQTSFIYRNGANLSARAGLDSLMQVADIYGRGQTWRLVQFYYQQSFGKDSRWNLRVGRNGQGDEFGLTPCDFMNLAFCQSQVGNMVMDYWYDWPISVWTARLRYKNPNWYIMGGAYQMNERNLRKKVILLGFKHTSGATLPIEFGWTPKFWKNRLPGKYRIGTWYNTTHGNDIAVAQDHKPLSISTEPPLRRKDRYGVYFLFDQQITGSATDDPDKGPMTTHGLSVFLYITQLGRKTARKDNQVSLGLYYLGPFKERRSDSIGFGFSRTNVNGRAARNEMLANPEKGKPHAEYTTEMFYNFQICPWIYFRPTVQWIVQPGGYRKRTDDVILGMKSMVIF